MCCMYVSLRYLSFLFHGYPGVKRPGRDAVRLPPSSAGVRNEWSCTSTLAVCLHGVDRDSFWFYHTFDVPVQGRCWRFIVAVWLFLCNCLLCRMRFALRWPAMMLGVQGVTCPMHQMWDTQGSGPLRRQTVWRLQITVGQYVMSYSRCEGL